MTKILEQYQFPDRFPESPAWLLANHKYKQTEAALRQMAKWNGVHVDDAPLLALVICFPNGLAQECTKSSTVH